MAKKSSASIAKIILQIAVGVFLAIAGIWALQGGGDFAVNSLKKVFSGDVAKIVAMIFGVIELIAGVLLVVEVFVGDKFGKFDNILGWIILIVWLAAIVIGDFIAKGAFKPDTLEWWYNLASHIIVGGAIWYLND